ncbi:MAG: hypothetical protein ACLFUU_01760 [Desulfobacteraceae bacterium]
MPKGKFVWTPVGGGPQTYNFPVNFSWNYQEACLDDNDRQRALDGTLRSYNRALKQFWRLDFSYISAAQKEQFWEIKQSGVDVDFYRDAKSSKTMTSAWVNDFNFVEVAPGYWSGTIELEEI